MMHKLRLEVSGPLGFKGNYVSVNKYVGVVTVCGMIQVGVNKYVLPTKGEGYPIILGRPWLIAMNVRQDWESRTLLLKPPREEGKSIQTIVYNVKEGRKEISKLETSEDELSTEDSSSTAEVTSSVSDSESEKASLLEAMGVVLTRPTTQDGGSIKETLSDEKIEDMLSTDLSKEERKEFEIMLQKHSPLFTLDYKQIKGVIVHHDESQLGHLLWNMVSNMQKANIRNVITNYLLIAASPPSRICSFAYCRHRAFTDSCAHPFKSSVPQHLCDLFSLLVLPNLITAVHSYGGDRKDPNSKRHLEYRCREFSLVFFKFLVLQLDDLEED
ncbi:hypothetical protein L7F22_068331 [Adiantum nelumboides]|nr:hypothetical protein [Adiantum nelumboides]